MTCLTRSERARIREDYEVRNIRIDTETGQVTGTTDRERGDGRPPLP